MGKFANYDPVENVIFVDYSNLTLTREIMQEVLDDYIEIYHRVKKKVYAVVCYNNTHLDEYQSGEGYKDISEELAKYRKGVVRWGLNDPYTSISLRMNVVRNKDQGSKSYVFSTRAEALKAVREREKEELQAGPL